MVFLFQVFFFLKLFCFALLNVLGSTWSRRKFKICNVCNEVNKRERDFMVY